MSFCRTDNPIADFEKHEAEQEKALKKLPKCDYCHEYIQEESYHQVDGKNICDECLDGCKVCNF